MRQKPFDPLEYIENAFFDTEPKPEKRASDDDIDVDIPSIGEYLAGRQSKAPVAPSVEPSGPKVRFRKTEMRAPRPRRASVRKAAPRIPAELQQVWESLPKNLEFLVSFFDDSVTARYYNGEFKESREDLIRRLLDPELSLEETSRLLGVCPATVRRYTNRGWLKHHRTQGGQRRFRLSSVVLFVEQHGRFPED